MSYLSSTNVRPKYSFSLRLKWEDTRSSSSRDNSLGCGIGNCLKRALGLSIWGHYHFWSKLFEIHNKLKYCYNNLIKLFKILYCTWTSSSSFLSSRRCTWQSLPSVIYNGGQEVRFKLSSVLVVYVVNGVLELITVNQHQPCLDNANHDISRTFQLCRNLVSVNANWQRSNISLQRAVLF